MIRLIMSYYTFPGIIVHELAHAWACRSMGIRVIKVCYLRLGNPMGYVLHDRPEHILQHIMVAVAPFFVSSLMALVVSLSASMVTVYHVLDDVQELVMPFSLWLGFSIALHAFPSSGDADSLWNEVKSPEVGVFAKLLLVPVVGLIRLVGLGSHVWLDMLYAIFVIAIPPLFVAAISV